MGMGNSGSSYEWGGQNMNGGVQGTQPLSIDTGLSNTRSMPTTPATTPPGNSMQTMQSYPNQQSYDNSRPIYSAPLPQQSQYPPQQNVAQQNMARFGQPIQSSHYMKNEMGPPSRAGGSGSENDPGDHKNDPYAHNQGNEQVGHGTGEEEAEHEHDNEYAHDNSTAYNANRGPYQYTPGPGIGPLHGEHPHLSPETVTGSPSHQNTSGRVTPRNTAVPQTQWAGPGSYTPPRGPPSSNLYSVMSDTRGSLPNGTANTDSYVSAAPLQPGYPSTNINGTPSNKRMRTDDDQDQSSHADNRGDDLDGLKRRKTVREDSVGGGMGAAFDRDGRPISRTRSTIVPRRR